jgi:hypothetical protein
MADPPRPSRVLVPEHIEIVAVFDGEAFPEAPAGAAWLCLACEERRPVSSSVRVRIRNRAGPAYERDACICSGCAARLG